MLEQKDIVLSTLNARYIHSAFGLRYLQANLGELQGQSEVVEFTLESKAQDVVEALLAYQPKIIGFGVYIWNVEQVTSIVAQLKLVAPQVRVVLGGPEVSYEWDSQPIVALCDYVITGWGEVSFAQLCGQLLQGQVFKEKVITGIQPALSEIVMPYGLYTDHDIKHRVLYVEASRGCPFKCEFCLSALDKTAWPFDLDLFLQAMDDLYQRGARHFKFVDRTFNLKVKNSLRIMQFFLDRMDDDLFLHFELIPDHLPEALKEKIQAFPAGSLQFEIGIQTFNPQVQSLISRKQNNELSKQNIRWLRDNTHAYIHADLIFGLPGEDLASFAESFNQLYALSPHEIQVGILKRLKGSPICRHTQAYALKFNPQPPFNVLQTSLVDFATQQKLSRFARFWDLIANSGRFKNTLPLLLSGNAFENFMGISEDIFQLSNQTHKISLLRLFDLLYQAGVVCLGRSELLLEALKQDFMVSGLKSMPKCLRQGGVLGADKKNKNKRNIRQLRH